MKPFYASQRNDNTMSTIDSTVSVLPRKWSRRRGRVWPGVYVKEYRPLPLPHQRVLDAEAVAAPTPKEPRENTDCYMISIKMPYTEVN